MRAHPRAALRAPLACAVVALVAAAATPVESVTFRGGGSTRTDCLAVFEIASDIPLRRGRPPRRVRCVDGDPCDADGTVDGRCTFPTAVCVNTAISARCTVRGVESVIVAHAEDDGDPKFDPEFQALQARITGALDEPELRAGVCTVPATVTVRVQGPFRRDRCRQGRKTLAARAHSTAADGRRVVDRDRLRLTCLPARAGCSPRAFFSGTFDRLQRQVFTPSCALGGCHDSQSTVADLLLEPGAAHGNLVNAVPTNAAARAAGWLRVTVSAPAVGTPETSYLLHKVTGDLPAGFGTRMPFGRRRLDTTLVDVVRRWIAAGAPESGWVPETD